MIDPSRSAKVIFCLDPALTCAGWAIFDQGILADCGYVRTKSEATLNARIEKIIQKCFEGEFDKDPDELVVEWPQIYRHSKGDPNDLLPVAAVAGSVIAMYGTTVDVTTYKPREWKGSVPKEVMCDRIRGRLDINERKLIESKKFKKYLEHNVLDAIGLGLKHMGRL